jgi:cell cycle checkpoint control protein RAD9A
LQALLSIFRRRLADARDKESALERCEFELQARPDQTECRLIFKLVCKSDVVKTYRLYYEGGAVMRPGFDRAYSNNYWTVSSRTLRDVVEYFGPKTDQLDWYFQDGKVTFTSYTEKIQNGRGTLHSPHRNPPDKSQKY